MRDPSVPWLVTAYVLAAVLLGGYAVRLVTLRRRSRGSKREPG
jgi:hypothetical protein